jgi:hypothetical protein
MNKIEQPPSEGQTEELAELIADYQRIQAPSNIAASVMANLPDESPARFNRLAIGVAATACLMMLGLWLEWTTQIPFGEGQRYSVVPSLQAAARTLPVKPIYQMPLMSQLGDLPSLPKAPQHPLKPSRMSDDDSAGDKNSQRL